MPPSLDEYTALLLGLVVVNRAKFFEANACTTLRPDIHLGAAVILGIPAD